MDVDVFFDMDVSIIGDVELQFIESVLKFGGSEFSGVEVEEKGEMFKEEGINGVEKQEVEKKLEDKLKSMNDEQK